MGPGYGKIIFFLNRRCRVGCPSCNVRASGTGPEELSPSWLNRFFPQLTGIPFPGHLLWTGGEPFLSPASLKMGLSLAFNRGWRSEILTSGDWFSGYPGGLDDLLDFRPFSLRISLDAEHQARVSFDELVLLIRRADDLGLEVNFTIRQLPARPGSRHDYLEQIKDRLPEFYRRNVQRSRWLHVIPHIPIDPLTGPGVTGHHPGSPKWAGPCSQGFKDLVIGTDGLLYPCCGLFSHSFSQKFAIGNLLTGDWRNLAAGIDRYPLLQALKTRGPGGICQELGLRPETWPWPGYLTPCHLCQALFYFHADRVFSHYRPG